MSLLTAHARVFRPIETSASIGWSTSPNEYEVGMADLTVGVLGVRCNWLRGNIWLAIAIANAVWLLGDAVGHLRQVAPANNHARNNSGTFVIAEILTPLVILFLALSMTATRRSPRPRAKNSSRTRCSSMPHGWPSLISASHVEDLLFG